MSFQEPHYQSQPFNGQQQYNEIPPTPNFNPQPNYYGQPPNQIQQQHGDTQFQPNIYNPHSYMQQQLPPMYAQQPFQQAPQFQNSTGYSIPNQYQPQLQDLNYRPAMSFQPVNPNVPIYSLQTAYNQPTPSINQVELIDPTIAIALELKQSVPSLRPTPTKEQLEKPQMKSAWTNYLRSVQDAQNAHTRRIRDAQVEHEKNVKDAEYYLQTNQIHQAQSMLHGSMRIGSLFEKAVRFKDNRESYKKRLDDARVNYERAVEHAHQQLNDAVEHANRTFDDYVLSL